MSQPALISPPLQRTAEVRFQTYKRSQAALARLPMSSFALPEMEGAHEYARSW